MRAWDYGCVCFGWKWFQEIIFTQTRMFGCNEKCNFPEIIFLLTKIYAFDPEMNLHSHFHFNSFPSHTRTQREQREWEKERRESKTHSNTERARERTRAPIQPPRAPSPKRTATQREWEKEPTTLIYLMPVTPSSTRRSPPRPTPEPAHIDPDQRPI